MRDRQVTFPVVIGLINEAPGKPVSGNVAQQILDIVCSLRRKDAGVLLVYQANAASIENVVTVANASGIECRPFVSDVSSASAGENGNEGTEGLELVEAIDILLVLSSEDKSETIAGGVDVLKYAKEIGRPIIEIDAETGLRRGEIPATLDQDSGWLPALFAGAGVSMQNDLSIIRDRIAAVAKRAKPATRRWWICLLITEALAVLLPLMWLTKQWTRAGLLHATIIFVCVITMVIIAWWLRWRGMQKTWARARLVAEVGRSILATQNCPRAPALAVFNIVPALRPLRWCKLPTVESGSGSEDWRERYIEKRIDNQARFYWDAEKKFEEERTTLNKWATLLLDLSLALAAAGFAIALSGRWVNIFRGPNIETGLAIAGAASVVGLMLIQTFSKLEDPTRRIAVYARQREMLRRAKARLEVVNSDSLAMDVVEDVEHELVGEATDWYFDVEKAEHFYSLRSPRERAPTIKSMPRGETWYGRWTRAVVKMGGVATMFALRVVIGRLLIVLVSAAGVLTWLGFHEPAETRLQSILIPSVVDGKGVGPRDAKETPVRSLVGQLGSFRDPESGALWAWDPDKTENAEAGCVIIAHGLWGQPASTDATGTPDWTKRMAQAIRKRMRKTGPSPNILILDWHDAAAPSDYLRFGAEARDFTEAVRDIAGIQPQAHDVGDLAGMRLARWIEEGKIKKDRPLHLIGHSAGGFVVARIATVLKALNTIPADCRVTLLDTPAVLPSLPGLPNFARDEQVLKTLPEICPRHVDFYITSNLVPLPKDFQQEGLHVYWPDHVSQGFEKDHLFACEWYIETIDGKEAAKGEGFDRSLPKKQ